MQLPDELDIDWDEENQPGLYEQLLIEVGEEKLTKLIKYQYGKFKYRENVFVAHFGEFFAKKNQPHTWTMDLAGCRLVLKRTHAIHHRYKAEFFF